ncbi:FAD/NAD(P)-binding protein [Actinokineospora inagensis]|uniref:FAD/NAD(P)-binding protein n=1 Tax=Actinokineospora inagensis TaxID=103730 RepID=UPI0003F5A9A1|nr:FAD/NAD(P)-binding protein [Actinokineospora inagensis]
MTAAVAVIGAGASGTLVAANLARLAAELDAPVLVHLVERSGTAGPGIAYSTTDNRHLMNTPVGKVSAYTADPDHLLRWTNDTQRSDFITRAEFGQYLHDTLHEAFAGSVVARLYEHHDDAVSVRDHDGGVEVTLAGGKVLRVAAAVLALGNSVTARTPAVFTRAGDRYLDAPWLTGVDAVRPGESVLLLGTGLSMVDIAATLSERPGVTVHALSRHGLLPTAHQTACSHGGHPELIAAVLAERDLTGLVRAFREAVSEAPDCWRALVDALRPHSFKIWEQLDHPDRDRFLTRFGRFWDVHRHRLPPVVATRLHDLIAAGRLTVTAGTPTACVPAADGLDVTIGRPHGVEHLTVDRIVNCAGFGRDVTAATDPLLRDLVARGVLVADPLRLGVHTDHIGRLIDRAGAVSPTLSTIGPLRRGTLFETTAIPEIRDQASAIAAHVLSTVATTCVSVTETAVPSSPGELVSLALRAARAPDPTRALTDLQRTIAAHRHTILRWLPGAGTDETLLYAGPDITILRVEIAPHTAFPPHDHQIPAFMSVLHGTEHNTYYRLSPTGLTTTAHTPTPAGGVIAMPPDTIHSVSNPTHPRSTALHIYPGDLFALSRTIWDLDTGTTHPYTDDNYFALARPFTL